MDFTWTFVTLFFELSSYLWPLLCFFVVIISLFGWIIGRIENWRVLDAIYFAFVTATTVGYGDIHPRQRLSKLLAILTALIGLVATGIIVAIGLTAAESAFEKHHDLTEIRRHIQD